jgi:hypothetical protein
MQSKEVERSREESLEAPKHKFCYCELTSSILETYSGSSLGAKFGIYTRLPTFLLTIIAIIPLYQGLADFVSKEPNSKY